MSDELETPLTVYDKLYLMSDKNIAVGFAGSNAIATAIVHRVNCHDRLVEALERISNYEPEYNYVQGDGHDIPASPFDRGKEEAAKEIAEIANAALAAAKGGNIE